MCFHSRLTCTLMEIRIAKCFQNECINESCVMPATKQRLTWSLLDASPVPSATSWPVAGAAAVSEELILLRIWWLAVGTGMMIGLDVHTHLNRLSTVHSGGRCAMLPAKGVRLLCDCDVSLSGLVNGKPSEKLIQNKHTTQSYVKKWFSLKYLMKSFWIFPHTHIKKRNTRNDKRTRQRTTTTALYKYNVHGAASQRAA